MQAAGASNAGSAQLGPGLGLVPAGRGAPCAADAAAQEDSDSDSDDELERFSTAPEQLEPEPDSQLDSEELERFSTAAEQPSYSTVPIVSAVWCCCR